MLQIEQFMCRTDNFAVLLHDEESGKTAAIDAPSARSIINKLEEKGWSLDLLLITHHHLDHTEAIKELKTKYSCHVIGPGAEADKIANLDKMVKDGDNITFAGCQIEIIATPGHTLGEVSYYWPNIKTVFTGDTLFSLGCGRIFEGTPQMMFDSLAKLAALPDDTKIYCGHEYSESNAQFALSIDPDNMELQKRADEIKKLRANRLPTLPVSIAQEKATNPFLRAHAPSIRQKLKLENATDLDVFTQIRRLKDNF